MSKQISFDPKELRKSEVVKGVDIPVDVYKSDFEAEKKLYGLDGLIGVYYDMRMIREFEMMLDSVKKTGEYRGVKFNHRGPAHLSAGQESACVGQALVLGPEDLIFGSHRSHGEILSKCFSAIRKMKDEDLQKIMEDFNEGETYKVVKENFPGETVKDTAENFVLYGALAEIYAKKTGFSKGLGGSMHTFFAPFGSMPNNAIVGGSGTISFGAALFKKLNRKPGIVIGNLGDGSMARGPVWEALVMSSMDQYDKLWTELPGRPPFLLNIFDNFYAMGGQPVGETMGYGMAARVGLGVNPEGMRTERVDGFNPLAVADAVSRKKKLLLEGKGPAMLDTITYRFTGHSPSDAMTYRTREELEAFEAQDPIPAYAAYLEKNGAIDKDGIARLDAKVMAKMLRTIQIVVDDAISPILGAKFIEDHMFSNGNVEKMQEGEAETLQKLEDNPRVRQIAGRHRYAFDENGKPWPAAKTYQYRDGVFEAMAYRFVRDPSMVAYGEDNRDWGGAFACYRGLTELLPYHRFFNSPISESAIVGSAVGYALSGGRVVAELMYCDFLGCAGDEVFNQMPKWQAMSAGVLKMPMVLRVSVGHKYGAQHSQDWSSLVANIPGLKAVYPATPYDAKGALNLALRGTDPYVFFESQKLYGIGEQFKPVPEGYYEIPEGEPSVKKEGKDITIIALGPALYTALDAAKVLKEKHGLDAEVIDLMWINPLRYETLVQSVNKTGRCVLVTDSAERGSYVHTVASNLDRLCFDKLDAPCVVVGSKNWITPPAEMEAYYFCHVSNILDAINDQIVPLEGHVPEHNYSDEEFLRIQKAGV